MAELRKITRSAPISNFQQVAPEAGGVFRLLGQAAETAYERIAPVAADRMAEAGSELGRQMARQQIGAPPAVSASSKGGAEPVAAGSTDGVADSLARTESGGNYNVVNSEGFTGKYQWGQARLDDYNRANGTSYKVADLRGNKALTEATQAWHQKDIMSNLGGYVGRVVKGITMTPGAIIGAAHLGGIGGARKFIESDGAYDPSDSNGTSLSDYARTHGGATLSTSGGAVSEPFTPTMLREVDGKLTARMYSPFSGPILQAHNAAAGVAYQSDVIVKGMGDLMGLQEQFLTDPTGFQDAARGYVDDIVKSAPDMFRGDIRAGLEKEVQRSVLGIMDARQREIRARANNSSNALMERYSDNLASAVASGNQDEIAAAQTELDSILYARERLPGVSWTPEQSENVRIKSRATGERQMQAALKGQETGWKAKLSTIFNSATNMMTAEGEELLDDPSIQAALPSEWNKAAAAVMLRDSMPELAAMNPAEVSKTIAEYAAQPVVNDFQVDMVEGMRDFEKKHREAFDKDPIQAAQTYFPESDKPPELPEFDPTNPQGYIAALQERAVYANGLVESGHTPRLTILSEAESKTASAAFGPDVPADMKAMGLGAVVAALGDDAATFFKNAGVNDPVMKHVGMMMARGGSEQAAIDALRGAELLATKQAQKPTKAATIGQIDAGIASALSGLSSQATDGIMQTAIAIAAARSPNVSDPDSDESNETMKTAIQAALGQSSDIHGRTKGGVQEVGGGMALLPPRVTGEDVQGALDKAFMDASNVSLGAMVRDEMARIMTFGNVSPEVYSGTTVNEDLWRGAAGDIPSLGGAPLEPSMWTSGLVQITPEGGTMYRMTLNIGGMLIDVGMESNPDAPFVFDIEKLISSAQYSSVAPEVVAEVARIRSGKPEAQPMAPGDDAPPDAGGAPLRANVDQTQDLIPREMMYPGKPAGSSSLQSMTADDVGVTLGGTDAITVPSPASPLNAPGSDAPPSIQNVNSRLGKIMSDARSVAGKSPELAKLMRDLPRDRELNDFEVREAGKKAIRIIDALPKSKKAKELLADLAEMVRGAQNRIQSGEGE